MSNISFLPFISEDSEPLKVYAKLKTEFPSMEIGKIFSIIMDYKLDKVKEFVAALATPVKNKKELKLFIENHFILQTDVKRIARIEHFITKCPKKWFNSCTQVNDLSHKDRTDFLVRLYMSKETAEKYIPTSVMKAISNDTLILGALKTFINIDDDSDNVITVNSLKDLEAEILYDYALNYNKEVKVKPTIRFALEAVV